MSKHHNIPYWDIGGAIRYSRKLAATYAAEQVNMKYIRLGLLLPLLMALYVYFMLDLTTLTLAGEHFPDTYDELPLQAESQVEPSARGPVTEKVVLAVKTVLPDRPRPEPKRNDRLKLPQDVIDRVKTFVFFLGFEHSGHSIVGSLMDSHPHIVISHEMDLFKKLSDGVIPPGKTEIFNAIWKNTVQTIIDGIRADNDKGYNLTVGNLYEGKYVDHIDVIGDKKGGKTVLLLMQQPKNGQVPSKL